MANPSCAFQEWLRVLKKKGVIFLVLPDKGGTFDDRRPVSAFSHLVRDLEMQTPEDDFTHLEEILTLHDLAWIRQQETVRHSKGGRARTSRIDAFIQQSAYCRSRKNQRFGYQIIAGRAWHATLSWTEIEQANLTAEH